MASCYTASPWCFTFQDSRRLLPVDNESTGKHVCSKLLVVRKYCGRDGRSAILQSCIRIKCLDKWTLNSQVLLRVSRTPPPQCSTNLPIYNLLYLLFSHSQAILGVYDFLLSDKSNLNYIKNCPGTSKLDYCSGRVFLFNSPKHVK